MSWEVSCSRGFSSLETLSEFCAAAGGVLTVMWKCVHEYSCVHRFGWRIILLPVGDTLPETIFVVGQRCFLLFSKSESKGLKMSAILETALTPHRSVNEIQTQGHHRNWFVSRRIYNEKYYFQCDLKHWVAWLNWKQNCLIIVLVHIYCVPGTDVIPLHVLTHLLLTTTLWGQYHYCSHCTGWEIKARHRKVKSLAQG